MIEYSDGGEEMRINRTKQLIADTLKLCVKEMSFKKVTVQILCERSGINRGTFYYHFRDISDLACWIYHTEITIPTSTVLWDEAQQGGYPYGLDKMFASREFYCQAWAVQGQNNLSEFAAAEFKASFTLLWGNYLQEQNRKPKRDYAIEDVLLYFGQAHYYAISEWVKSGMQMPIEQLFKLLYTVSYTGVMAALVDASEPN